MSQPCHGRGKDCGQSCIQHWGQLTILGRCGTVGTLPRSRKKVWTVLYPTLGAVLYWGDASMSPLCHGRGKDWGQACIQCWGKSILGRCVNVATLPRARKRLGTVLYPTLGAVLYWGDASMSQPCHTARSERALHHILHRSMAGRFRRDHRVKGLRKESASRNFSTNFSRGALGDRALPLRVSRAVWQGGDSAAKRGGACSSPGARLAIIWREVCSSGAARRNVF